MLKVAPLFSGSSGNSMYISDGKVQLLVDAGVSGTRIQQELKQAGIDAAMLNGILITHEHSDHISGVGILSRRFNLPVYASGGTWDAMEKKLGEIHPANRRVIAPSQDFYLGAMNVMPFPIPHDAAEPVGYAFAESGIKVSIATDIGCMADAWMREVENSDLLLLEANHDLEMLKAGRYPYELKRRIMGKKGHLSNEDAGRAALALFERGVKQFILGHLSNENNFPELALTTVENAFRSVGIRPNEDVTLSIARRHGLTGTYTLQTQQDKGAQYAGL